MFLVSVGVTPDLLSLSMGIFMECSLLSTLFAAKWLVVSNSSGQVRTAMSKFSYGDASGSALGQTSRISSRSFMISVMVTLSLDLSCSFPPR